MSISQVIKEAATRLGFDLVGITTPDPPPHWPVFMKWLEMGRNGSMTYLADPRREAPRLVMKECRSILVLGARYPFPKADRSDSDPPGRIAAYAKVTDYHLVLPEKLKALVEHLQQETRTEFPYKIYTDTGPLLERELGQRAGLGWIGKNTCLINQDFGSTFFLAEILLGIELEADTPFDADRCGTCTRCIDACPTACILPDRTLDARKCISFLTIENKGEIPSHLRSKLGSWIFGCDICQEVCPWNRAPRPLETSFFQNPPETTGGRLEEELGISALEFKQKFKLKPILRAKRRGYLRNTATVLGNLKNPDSIPALENAILDTDTLIREHAKWAVDQIRSSNPQFK